MEIQEVKRRMHSGEVYICSDPRLTGEQARFQDLMYEYNQTRPSDPQKQQALLKQLFAEIGENTFIQPPFYANWGGKHVHLGHDVYANFNLTLVDDTHIYVGDHVLLGPNVTICTATHPIDPDSRRRAAEYNLPVRIGNNAWIGGNVFIMPGVTIGENSVIGAGSLVTRDIPANVVALGSPCRVLREITPEDRETYRNGMKIDV